MRQFLWIGVLAVLAPVAAAQVLECTNAKGEKEFAQFCPPGTIQQRQVVKDSDAAGGTPAAGAAPKTIEMQEVEFKKRLLERQEAEAKAEKDKAQAEENERNCIEARAQLKAATEGQRMQRFDPVTGERVQFGDAERADEIERQRKAVERWCK